MKHWSNRLLSSAMEKWMDACRFARVAKRALMRMYLRAMSKAWAQWGEAIELQKYERTEGGHGDMRSRMDQLRAENERLRRDNERFVRLIDSGQWSRARVDEISKAGLTLQQERAELSRLILALNAGNREWLTPMERNKMLLKGASSLNAVDRAIKARAASDARKCILTTHTGSLCNGCWNADVLWVVLIYPRTRSRTSWTAAGGSRTRISCTP